MTPEQMAALDEMPARRVVPGGVVSMEYAEHRSGGRVGCRWRTICELSGIDYDAGSTARICARCLAKAREAWRWLDAECARLDARERDARPTRPPLGLRVGP